MRTTLLTLVVASAPAVALAEPSTLTVTSNAFVDHSTIPIRYTCDGAGVAPELSWDGVPADTQSVAVLVEDPDAPSGTFTHWLVTGIKPSVRELYRGGDIPDGAFAMMNSNGDNGYAGPCPPSGTHHYHFRVFALDNTPLVSNTRAAFLREIDGHVLAQGELVGLYERHRP